MASHSVKYLLKLLSGPFAFILTVFFLSPSVFSIFAQRAAIGTILWMALWWIFAPVDFAITAFLPIALNALFSMANMSSVIQNYASETILLLLGASILTVSWEETGLDKRIAATFLSLIGGSVRNQIFFWYILSALLSSILPNAVVCATITPIAVSMLRYAGEGDISKSKTGSLILLTIVYAAGVGGLATPLGGAMNLVTVDYLQQLIGTEYFYTSWVIRFLPITVFVSVLNILYLLCFVPKGASFSKSKEYFRNTSKNLPPMSACEWMSFILFIFATIMSFSRQLYQTFLPDLKPAYVFIICGILSFLIRKDDGHPLMVWKSVQRRIIWDLIFIFAGGLAAGTLMNESQAASSIGVLVSELGSAGGIIMVFIILAFTLVLSDVTSNTATAAIAMPTVISIATGLELNPIPYIYVAAIGVNLSFVFPTSIRAVPVGYGLNPKYMFKKGLSFSILLLIILTGVCGFLLKSVPAFSTI